MPGCQYCTEGVTPEGWICTRCKGQQTIPETTAPSSTSSPNPQSNGEKNETRQRSYKRQQM
ncbi:hypothetical protein CDEST_01311 [Colletotrichum destructivum]|uniref:Uncharacterized protein n=1 Tax=Colletotrichum destructivum TaxID=34406 RepID=A0AAX4HYY7_9PEZI|nr:hypothetical protein CDEST_01311 [Colletotrichum destructivum]